MTRVVVLALLLLASCASPTDRALMPSSVPTLTVEQATAPPATAEAKAVATPGPTPTLHPALVGATLPALMTRTFESTPIETMRILTVTDAITTSLVAYTSDGVKITGLMNTPRARGPFPAVVLLHGYVPPDQYSRGLDTRGAANDLANHGYVTLEPDLRGFAESGHGANLFLSGFTADAVNAAVALKTLPNVDAKRIGLWGHSMGAGVATRALLVSDVFAAVVLYAPLSADMNEMFMDPFGGEEQGVTRELIASLVAAVDNDGFRAQLSPKNYLDRAHAPVSIHVGAQDQVTPPAWARALRDGFQRAGKRVEYFEYDGQGHSFRDDAEDEFRARVLDFFNRTFK